MQTSAADKFWQAASKDKLLIPRCIETGRCFFYPREYSPFTGGDVEWLECSGMGEIYSCSVNYRADPLYCIAYVQLQEGPIILSNILADDLELMKKAGPGDKVKVIFKQDESGRKTPYFELR